VSHNGKGVLLRVEGTGEIVADPAVPAGNAYTVTAQAIEPSRLYTWPVPEFDALARRFPALSENTKRILVERLRALEERFCDLATQPVPKRLARMLLRLHEHAHVALTCEDLADMSGTTQFTVSRLLREWEEQEIIQRVQKAVVVENLPALTELAM